MHTFFLPPEAWRAPWQLDGAEAHHFSAVLRGKAGEQIRLIDGKGREGFFAVASVAKRAVHLELLREDTHPRPKRETVLALAWTKAARRGWIMEKAVELNASAIWIWQGEHSQMRLPQSPPDSWQQQLIAGAKQCGNPWLPELRLFPGGAAELIRELPTVDHALVLWEEEREAFLSPEALARPGRTLFVIGPEGGLSRAEVDLFKQSGLPAVTVGRSVLRYETAALLCLSLSWWGRERADAQENAG